MSPRAHSAFSGRRLLSTTGPTDRKSLQFSTVFLLLAIPGSWAQKAVSSAQKKSEACRLTQPGLSPQAPAESVRDQGHLWDGGLQPRSVGWGWSRIFCEQGVGWETSGNDKIRGPELPLADLGAPWGVDGGEWGTLGRTLYI